MGTPEGHQRGQLPALVSVGTSEHACIDLEPYRIPSVNDTAPQASLPPKSFQMPWPESPHF